MTFCGWLRIDSGLRQAADLLICADERTYSLVGKAVLQLKIILVRLTVSFKAYDTHIIQFNMEFYITSQTMQINAPDVKFLL